MKKNSPHHATAIVFGGSGFLGSHVSDALTDRGFKVTLFDLMPSKYLHSDQRMIVGDIRDVRAVKAALRGMDYVYNFAGSANLDTGSAQPLNTAEMNIIGNINILNASVEAKVKRFVYASTIYVYSEKGGFYRCSKQASELYIEEYSRRYGLPFTILRYGTLYGPRAHEGNSIYSYLKQALTTGRVVCHGSFDALRDYVHVRDAARLSVKILDPQYNGKHIIISGLHPFKFEEMLHLVGEILGKKLKIVKNKAQKHNPSHYDYTPYSFIPKIGDKLTSNVYTDMGQGLLECLHEIHQVGHSDSNGRPVSLRSRRTQTQRRTS